MFQRLLRPSLARSFFLFGPRSTGKSTLLRSLLPATEALWIDLLHPRLERSLSGDPGRLADTLDHELATLKRPWVVIDEIQKVPALLSVVHRHIFEKKFRFAMTGSSARKLKRGGANLLGGRASLFEMSPLTHLELADQFDLDTVLNWGSLPEIFTLAHTERAEFLEAYCTIYLKEEIIAEQLVRQVQPFRNFMELVALQNAQIINYSHFARDCGVDIKTIQTYFEILQDTLVGFELPPFHDSIRKRQRKNPKFFLFDTGVTRAMAGMIESPLQPRTTTYGKYFEQFIVTEIRRLMQCHERHWRLSYLTSKDGAEIDLIIDRRPQRIALEIKSSDQVNEIEVRAFERLAGDLPQTRLIFASLDPHPKRYGNVDCLPWRDALTEIFKKAPDT